MIHIKFLNLFTDTENYNTEKSQETGEDFDGKFYFKKTVTLP